MINIVLEWIDGFWLLLALTVVRKSQRAWALVFIVACMAMMRLQVELMESLNYPDGMLSLINLHVFYRGQAVYSIFYAFYLIAAHYSPDRQGILLMEGSIMLFLAALFVSMFVMVL